MRVRYDKNQPHVEAERKASRKRATAQGVHKPHRLPTSSQGRRLSSSKREEREQRQRALRARRTAVAVAALVLLTACIWGVVAAARGSAFAITSTEVEGVSHLSSEQVVGLARIPAGASLFTLDRDAVAERVAASPWVARVEVLRDFPHTLRVVVVERVPAAAVDAGGDKLWVVSRDGYWLGERSLEESSAVVIRDLEEVAPQPGKRVRSTVLANAIRVVTQLSPEMLAMTRMVSAPSIEKTALVTNENVQVFIGEAERVRTKERIARKILSTERGKVVYINVRVVESPTWRGLSE